MSNLTGFSIGGMVAQEIALQAPDLVRKLILVGTGPRGGEGMASLSGSSAPPLIYPSTSGSRSSHSVRGGPGGRKGVPEAQASSPGGARSRG